MVRRLAALVGWTFCALLISIPAHAFQLALFDGSEEVVGAISPTQA